MATYLFKVAVTTTVWKYIPSGEVANIQAGQIAALDQVIRPAAPNVYGVRGTIEDAWIGGIIDETNSALSQIVHGTNLDGRTEGTIV